MAEHRVGLVQRLRRAGGSRRCPCRWRSATSCISSSVLGRNSCSGGSSSRMVTGRPSMMRNSSTKSSRCIGRILASARAAALGIVGQDHLAHGDDAVGVEEHVLGAAEADALGAEAARRARRRAACRRWRARPCVRTSSAQPIRVAKSPDSSGWMVGTSPSMTSPVEPSMVMTSPAFTTCSRDRDGAWRDSRCADRRRRRRRRRPMPRATTAAWLVMPPRAVRMPSAACMPWMSSGLVSMRTRITASPLLGARLGLVGGEDDDARGRARRGRQAARQHRLRAPWDRASDAAAGRASRARCARIASALSISPRCDHIDGDLERRRRRALAGARLQHVELALLHRELDVLHVAVMRFERVAHLVELARTPPA